MLAYVLLLSALSGLEGASVNHCGVTEAKKYAGDIKELKLRCPCNETSGLDIDHKQNECNCFQIPKMTQNCNLSCFEDGVNEYKGNGTIREIADSKLKNFIAKTFHQRVKTCKYPCFHPCDEMEKVNATKFWETLHVAFQNIITHQRSHLKV
ncbi:uncharacterized protein ACNLHF_016408 isoform 1-T2 [Anomaloglossus baeobatrachus]